VHVGNRRPTLRDLSHRNIDARGGILCYEFLILVTEGDETPENEPKEEMHRTLIHMYAGGP
jgi:hypothetical protein